MVNGPNTYLYALSNPVNMIDPSGLKFTIRTGTSSKPLRKPNTSTINVFYVPDFEFEFQMSINANTESYPSVQLGPIYMDQKAKKCWQSSTTRINEWKYKDNYWFYLALWLQVNIDPDLKDKAAKAAEKASDLAAGEDLVGAVNTGLGWIPGVSTALSIGIDLASMAAGEALNSGEAYENAIDKLMDAMNGAYASVADWEFWYNNWQSDFEDIGYIIEGTPKEVACPPSYDKTGGPKDKDGHDPITPKPVYTPGHGSCKPPDDILWDPPRGGNPPNVPTGPSGFQNPGGPEPYRLWTDRQKPYTLSGPHILWDPVRKSPGGQNILWKGGSGFDEVVQQMVDYAVYSHKPKPPAQLYFNPPDLDDFVSTRTLIYNLVPDDIWKSESEKKYYYKSLTQNFYQQSPIVGDALWPWYGF
jgi:hypothetical protein